MCVSVNRWNLSYDTTEVEKVPLMIREVHWTAVRVLEWVRQTSPKNDIDSLRELLMAQHDLGTKRVQRTAKVKAEIFQIIDLKTLKLLFREHSELILKCLMQTFYS